MLVDSVGANHIVQPIDVDQPDADAVKMQLLVGRNNGCAQQIIWRRRAGKVQPNFVERCQLMRVIQLGRLCLLRCVFGRGAIGDVVQREQYPFAFGLAIIQGRECCLEATPIVRCHLFDRAGHALGKQPRQRWKCRECSHCWRAVGGPSFAEKLRHAAIHVHQAAGRVDDGNAVGNLVEDRTPGNRLDFEQAITKERPRHEQRDDGHDVE